MFSLITNKQGFTLLEVVFAMTLVAVAVFAIFSLQPRGWQAASKADLKGRAAEILYQELETQQVRIMNPDNAINDQDVSRTINVSGLASLIKGDAPYTVRTIIARTIIGGQPSNRWLITVTVTWPRSTTGIQESLIATRQERFRF